ASSSNPDLPHNEPDEPAAEAAPQANSMFEPAETKRGRTPTWDRDRQELRVGNVVVKRFKIPSFGPEVLLAAFEEKQWPSYIADPLSATRPARNARLQDA